MKTKHVSIPELDAEENLRADNALTALSLESQFPAHTFISDDAPPELVQQFLEQVAKFETDWKEHKTTSIYEKIGSPAFAEPDSLEASTLPGALEHVMGLLEEHRFIILRPDHVPDAVFYRFIVEEVFPAETNADDYPGMVHCMDYAEFHPDKQVLIGKTTEIFLLSMLQLDRVFPDTMLSEHCRDEHNAISRKEALAAIERFRAAYTSFVPVAFKLEELIEQPNGTWQTFGICWEGVPAGGGPKEQYEGLGVMQLAFEQDQWLVQGVLMPGFAF